MSENTPEPQTDTVPIPVTNDEQNQAAQGDNGDAQPFTEDPNVQGDGDATDDTPGDHGDAPADPNNEPAPENNA